MHTVKSKIFDGVSLTGTFPDTSIPLQSNRDTEPHASINSVRLPSSLAIRTTVSLDARGRFERRREKLSVSSHVTTVLPLRRGEMDGSGFD